MTFLRNFAVKGNSEIGWKPEMDMRLRKGVCVCLRESESERERR